MVNLQKKNLHFPVYREFPCKWKLQFPWLQENPLVISVTRLLKIVTNILQNIAKWLHLLRWFQKHTCMGFWVPIVACLCFVHDILGAQNVHGQYRVYRCLLYRVIHNVQITKNDQFTAIVTLKQNILINSLNFRKTNKNCNNLSNFTNNVVFLSAS